MSDEQNWGYILRVSTDDWVNPIYELKKIYSGVMRNWRRDSTMLLAKKTQVGDSFIGYGVIGKVEMLWALTPEEETYCRENNWKCALSLIAMTQFKNPYPIKQTLLAADPRKGAFLHGARLTEQQVDEILEEAEDCQSEIITI